MPKIVYFLLLISSISIAQQNLDKEISVIDFNDVYVENDLIYDYRTEKLYTGYIHKTKKNGRLTQDEYVENGVTRYLTVYYRNDLKQPYSTYVYNKESPYALSELKLYDKNGNIKDVVYYDNSGKKILEESFDKGRLIYRAEYNGRKRHGKEFCITEECDTTVVFYKNGKKLKAN